jgi:hypothetical protein
MRLNLPGDFVMRDLWYDKLNSVYRFYVSAVFADYKKPHKNSLTIKRLKMYVNFFQKNKLAIVVLLIVSFLVAILLIFISGIADSNSDPTPTGNVLYQQSTLATSTNNVTPSTPRPTATQGSSSKQSSPTPTVVSTQDAGSPPPTLQPSITDVLPGTDAPLPSTIEDPPTEAPPAGNGPPPGS